MPARTLFVTGTDTNVGKTVVCAGLVSAALYAGLKVCYYKPIQTGSPNLESPEDPGQIWYWLGEEPGLTTYCSYNFLDPVTPMVADPEETIRFEQIQRDLKHLQAEHDVVIVEGAGGVRVPVTPQLEMIHLMQFLDEQVLVVARPNLGTINHTLLTLEALKTRRIPVVGVAVSGYPLFPPDKAIKTLPDVFKSVLPVPLLALLPEIALERSVLDIPPVAFQELLEKLVPVKEMTAQ
jgi:dethiobiotin synthetase